MQGERYGRPSVSRTAGDYFTYLIAMPRSVAAFSELDLPLCGDYGGVRGSSPHTEVVKRRLVTSDPSMVFADVALKRRGTRRPIAETVKSGSCYRSLEFAKCGLANRNNMLQPHSMAWASWWRLLITRIGRNFGEEVHDFHTVVTVVR